LELNPVGLLSKEAPVLKLAIAGEHFVSISRAISPHSRTDAELAERLASPSSEGSQQFFGEG
jgi:hypothetical protein